VPLQRLGDRSAFEALLFRQLVQQAAVEADDRGPGRDPLRVALAPGNRLLMVVSPGSDIDER
jgi:hypothetical protein